MTAQPAVGTPPRRWSGDRLLLPGLLLAGMGSSLAFAPWSLLPALATLSLLLTALKSAKRWRQAWRRAVVFLFGHATVSLYWIAIAFTVDVERFGAFAVPAVAILCVAVAAIQGTVLSLLFLFRSQNSVAAWLHFGVLWVAAELVRGFLLQFPWNPLGATAADWPWLAQTVALLGVSGLSLVLVLIATLPALFVNLEAEFRRQAIGASALSALGLGLLLTWGAARLSDQPASSAAPVRLVQGAFALDHGYDRDRLERWFTQQLMLTQEPAMAPPSAVIWAEGASPYYLDTDAAARQWIAQSLRTLPGEQVLITGGDRLLFSDNGELSAVANGLFVVDEAATLQATYEKVHLVPFGEFLPLRRAFELIGLDKLTAGSVDYRSGPSAVTIDVAGFPAFSPLICYEVIFSGRAVGEPRPNLLVNITNDTWFGDSAGPYQHLAMARLRAIEEGLPILRVANSGITANLDPYGRILDSKGLGERAVLDVYLTEALEPTLFARWGSMPLILAMAGLLGLARILAKRIRRHSL